MEKLKKLDLKCFFALCIVFTVIYVVTRYCLGDLYTPEWAARHILIFVFIFLEVMALLGYRKFVITVTAGYIAGLVFGEVFGGFESHIGPQYHHWGWLIFIVTIIVFCIIGYWIEKKLHKNR